jgi:hypothetical protein
VHAVVLQSRGCKHACLLSSWLIAGQVLVLYCRCWRVQQEQCRPYFPACAVSASHAGPTLASNTVCKQVNATVGAVVYSRPCGCGKLLKVLPYSATVLQVKAPAGQADHVMCPDSSCWTEVVLDGKRGAWLCIRSCLSTSTMHRVCRPRRQTSIHTYVLKMSVSSRLQLSLLRVAHCRQVVSAP